MPDEEKKEMSPEEKKADIERRMKGFNADLIPLLKKWSFGLSGEAFITKDGRIAARSILVDDTRAPEEKEKTELASA